MPFAGWLQRACHFCCRAVETPASCMTQTRLHEPALRIWGFCGGGRSEAPCQPQPVGCLVTIDAPHSDGRGRRPPPPVLLLLLLLSVAEHSAASVTPGRHSSLAVSACVSVARPLCIVTRKGGRGTGRLIVGHCVLLAAGPPHPGHASPKHNSWRIPFFALSCPPLVSKHTTWQAPPLVRSPAEGVPIHGVTPQQPRGLGHRHAQAAGKVVVAKLKAIGQVPAECRQGMLHEHPGTGTTAGSRCACRVRRRRLPEADRVACQLATHLMPSRYLFPSFRSLHFLLLPSVA